MDSLTKFLGKYPATCFQKVPSEMVLALFKIPILSYGSLCKQGKARQGGDTMG